MSDFERDLSPTGCIWCDLFDVNSYHIADPAAAGNITGHDQAQRPVRERRPVLLIGKLNLPARKVRRDFAECD